MTKRADEHYRGRLLRWRSFGALSLVETRFRPRTVVPTHTHDHAYLSFLLSGSYTEHSRTGPRDCVAGTVLFHPPGETHSDEFHARGGQVLNVQLEREWLEDGFDGIAPKERVVPIAQPAFAAGLRLHLEFDSASGAAVNGLALSILDEIASQQRRPPPTRWMMRALAFIHKAMEEGDEITLCGVARHAGIHPVHLARSFRIYAGANFSHYVRDERLRRALARLVETSETITQIAMACGFSDHPHLCRTIKIATGLSPTRLREMLRDVN